MIKLSRLRFCALAGLLWALPAQSATIYSSLLSPPNASAGKLVGTLSGFEPAVEIPASLQSYTGIEVSVGVLGPVGRRFEVNLRSDSGGVPGPILASAESVPLQDSFDAFFNGWSGYPTVKLPGVVIAANTTYWLSVFAQPSELGLGWGFASSSTSPDIPKAGVLVDGSWFPEPFSSRGGFEVRGDAVPEPSTGLACLASALMIGACRRRRLRLHQA